MDALVDPGFSGFARKRVVRFSAAAGMTEYSDKLSTLLTTFFPAMSLRNVMGELVAQAGLKQLRIADSLHNEASSVTATHHRLLGDKVCRREQQPDLCRSRRQTTALNDCRL